MLAKSTNNALAIVTNPTTSTIQLQHNIELLVLVHKTLALCLYVVSAFHLCRALSSYTHFPRFPRAHGVWLRRLLFVLSLCNAAAVWLVLVTFADRWLQSSDDSALQSVDSKLERLQRRLSRANAVDGRVLMLWMYVLGFAMATVAIQFRWQTQLQSYVQYVPRAFAINIHANRLSGYSKRNMNNQTVFVRPRGGLRNRTLRALSAATAQQRCATIVCRLRSFVCQPEASSSPNAGTRTER